MWKKPSAPLNPRLNGGKSASVEINRAFRYHKTRKAFGIQIKIGGIIMSNHKIGGIIAGLRREKGCTQEELARAVCVSPQAVSKWENGGVPDTELLPAIADFFAVPIDVLFGRSGAGYQDIMRELPKKIADTAPAQSFDAVFNLCWVLEQAMSGSMPEDGSIQDFRESMGRNRQIYSSKADDYGYTRMNISDRLPYFLIVPEAGDKEAAFFTGIDYPALFKLLSDPDVFNTLVLLNRRDHSKLFTPELLVKELGLDARQAGDILRGLQLYGLVMGMPAELDGAAQELYRFLPTPSFTAMLIFARELIDRPHTFVYLSEHRTKPYLA